MIETRRLKNVEIFIQTILSFVLSRKKFQNWISIFSKLNSIPELFSIAFTDLYYESYQDLLSYSTEGITKLSYYPIFPEKDWGWWSSS